jgi:hypothetical protein
MEEEASAELISPRISFSHDLAIFAAAATTPSRPDTSSIGTSVVNMLSYLLCDCREKGAKSRGFGVNWDNQVLVY